MTLILNWVATDPRKAIMGVIGYGTAILRRSGPSPLVGLLGEKAIVWGRNLFRVALYLYNGMFCLSNRVSSVTSAHFS
jgi:hypothetical protein